MQFSSVPCYPDYLSLTPSHYCLPPVDKNLYDITTKAYDFHVKSFMLRRKNVISFPFEYLLLFFSLEFVQNRSYYIIPDFFF